MGQQLPLVGFCCNNTVRYLISPSAVFEGNAYPIFCILQTCLHSKHLSSPPRCLPPRRHHPTVPFCLTELSSLARRTKKAPHTASSLTEVKYGPAQRVWKTSRASPAGSCLRWSCVAAPCRSAGLVTAIQRSSAVRHRLHRRLACQSARLSYITHIAMINGAGKQPELVGLRGLPDAVGENCGSPPGERELKCKTSGKW